MNRFSEDERKHIHALSSALRNVDITEKEMSDMRLLYKSSNGIPFDSIDDRNRPQGPTIKSSSTLGSKIKRAIDAPTSLFGMSLVGYSKGDDRWYMKDVFRAAIEEAGLFAANPVIPDEIIPWNESEDEFDEDEQIVDDILADESIPETVREQLILARVGQGKFRERVELVSGKCRLTGVSDSNFLIASHIKPWRVCDNEERLDGHNGLMLSPHADQLFDEGYISFNDNGALIVSEALAPDILKAWSIDTSVNAGALTQLQSKYMAYHREYVFIWR